MSEEMREGIGHEWKRGGAFMQTQEKGRERMVREVRMQRGAFVTEKEKGGMHEPTHASGVMDGCMQGGSGMRKSEKEIR